MADLLQEVSVPMDRLLVIRMSRITKKILGFLFLVILDICITYWDNKTL